MPKYPAKEKPSEKTKEEALKVARATQKPGQTKEQTKLIAQGIQKGIEQYKKQHKAKLRELDKKHHKVAAKNSTTSPSDENGADSVTTKTNTIPWVLLVLSWLGFAAYLLVGKLV